MEIVKPAGVRRRATSLQQANFPVSQTNVESFRLERVYGSGSCTTKTVACPHPIAPGIIAYSSGAVVVLYDSLRKQQTAFYSPKPRRSQGSGKSYACLAFSRDGAYLVAGEHVGVNSSAEILIWEAISSQNLQVLRGHKHGVGSVAFSQDGRLLLSTGQSYDGQLCVWDWQKGTLLVKQHTAAQLQRACFVEEHTAGASSAIVTTVGKQGHFKVWSLTLPSGRGRDSHAAAGQAALTPRPANLKEYRTSNFVGVACSPSEGSVQQPPALLYALTQNGILLTLRPATRVIDKSVNLQVKAAFALAISASLIACACDAGVVRLFVTRTLAFKSNLPRPSSARSCGGAGPDAVGIKGACVADPTASAGALYPDAVGCVFDCTGERLVVTYADRSLMLWDVRNPTKAARMRSILTHSGIVWGAAMIPAWQAALMEQPLVSPAPSVREESAPGFAPSAVLCTCGADGTIRLWNVCLDNSASTAGPLGVPAEAAAAARVTRTLRAIIFVNPPNGLESALSSGLPFGQRRFTPDAPLPAPGAGSGGGATATGTASTKPIGLRCIRVSPCGRHLATGDTRGNLRVYKLSTLEQILMKEAHDAEILSLDYSPPSLDGTCYLASSSRDAFVHVYDMKRDYELVGTCDVHTGPVTAVRFSANGGRLALLSCSADKSVVFRLVKLGACGLVFEKYHTERMTRGMLYDMAVDAAGSRAVAVGEGSQLRVFDVATGRAIRNFNGDITCGEAVAVTIDSTGQLAICSCEDGSAAVYDLDSSTLLARGAGHSELCTGAVLLEGHRGLVTVGADGCALLWRLPPQLTQRMEEAVVEHRRQLEQQAVAQAALVQQREQEPQPWELDRPFTPRRRRAWHLNNGGSGGSGGGAAAPDVGPSRVPDEPRLVPADLSATIDRVREGKAILSADKLPKWAQHSAGGVRGSDDAADLEPGCSTFDAAAAILAAQRSMELPSAPDPMTAAESHPPYSDAAQPAVGAAAPDDHSSPFSAAATATEMAARAGALAGQPRTWAEVVEEDDEIVFCDSLEDGQMPSAPQDAAAAHDVARGAKGMSPLDHLASPERPGAAAASGALAHGDAKQRDVDADGDAFMDAQSAGSPVATEVLTEPPSGCGSSRPGGRPPEEAAAADSDTVRRDLFKEHFDSLGLDQASATKAPPRDPRRLSFTHMYRQARASSAGANVTEPAIGLLPTEDEAAGTSGSDALQPLLARMALPAGITTGRGGASFAGTMEPKAAEGTTVIAGWTPERSMLPLMSPALAQAAKQLQELEGIRMRLLGTLRKPSANGDAPGDGPCNRTDTPSPVLEAKMAAGPPPPPSPRLVALPVLTAVEDPDAQQPDATQQQQKAVQSVEEAPAQSFPAPSPPDVMFNAPAAAMAEEAAQQPARISQLPSRELAGLFMLPNPPGGISAPPSPNFSALSDGTSMLGQRAPNDASPEVCSRQESVLQIMPPEAVVWQPNSFFGTSPGTPVAGLSALANGGVAALMRPATAEDLVRAVLSEPLSDESPSHGGVCVVTTEGGTLSGKEQQLEQVGELAVVAVEPGPADVWQSVAVGEGVAVAAAAEQEQGGDGEGLQRRLRQPLPAMKPRVGSPVKGGASREVQHQESVVVAAEQTGEATLGGAALVIDRYKDTLSRMRMVLREFVCAHSELQAAAAASAPTDADTADTYEQAACTVAHLAEILNRQTLAEDGPRPVMANADTVEAPQVVMCPSPPIEARSGVKSSSRVTRQWTRSSMMNGSVAAGDDVGSSQVILEMDAVESLVEEKLEQRMKEEMQRVEENVMQRIMQQMMRQQ